MKKVILLISIVFCWWISLSAQELNIDQLAEMSLEDLMNMEIVSASKKAESSFDAPLSASVISAQELKNAGVTTIAEALRLIPGLIVREQTNGVYDPHLRGFDYIPYSALPYTQNQITLVMIDNRIVFRDFQGGTYWESLPVEIADIDRIEVVRGPSSALYGPNAVAGVINIITRRAGKNGGEDKNESGIINFQRGSYQSDIFSLNTGFTKGKYSLNISGNMQKRNRYQTTYWDYVKGKYWDNPDSCYSPQTQGAGAFRGSGSLRYPDRSLALDKYGINLFNTYQVSEKINFELAMGLQRSKVQKIYVDVINTPFTTEVSETEYLDFKSAAYGASLQASYLKGYQNTLGVTGWEYDFSDLALNLEYDWQLLENKLSVRPGVSYRQFSIDDSIGRKNSSSGLALLNGEYDLTTTGYSLRADYKPLDPLRVVVALRGDQYNHPSDKMYLSYQFASTWKFNENHLARFVVSRANKGANMLDNYVNFHYVTPGIEMHYSPNQDLKLMTMDMFEVGYRGKLRKNLHADIELFYAKAQDYSSATVTDSTVYAPKYKVYFSAQNLTVKPKQMGVTLALNYILHENFQLRPYITWQHSELDDVLENLSNPIDSAVTEEGAYTPNWYGGFYLNFVPYSRLNINLNPYFMSQSVMRYQYNKNCKIYNTLILNGKVAYKVTETMSVFLNMRNLNIYTQLVNDKKESYTELTRQFAFSDNIKTVFYLGFDVNF